MLLSARIFECPCAIVPEQTVLKEEKDPHAPIRGTSTCVYQCTVRPHNKLVPGAAQLPR